MEACSTFSCFAACRRVPYYVGDTRPAATATYSDHDGSGSVSSSEYASPPPMQAGCCPCDCHNEAESAAAAAAAAPSPSVQSARSQQPADFVHRSSGSQLEIGVRGGETSSSSSSSSEEGEVSAEGQRDSFDRGPLAGSSPTPCSECSDEIVRQASNSSMVFERGNGWSGVSGVPGLGFSLPATNRPVSAACDADFDAAWGESAAAAAAAASASEKADSGKSMLQV